MLNTNRQGYFRNSQSNPAGKPVEAAFAAETIMHSPEELEKIQQNALAMDKLGLYSNSALLAGVLDEKEDPTRQGAIKNKLGVYVKPGDPDYEQAKEDMAKHEASWNISESPASAALTGETTVAGQDTKFNDQSFKAAQEEKKEEIKEKIEEHKEYKQTEEEIKTMVVQDAGSKDPHKQADMKAQQDMVKGASLAAIKDLRGKMAAITGTAFAGVEDVNPEKLGQMHADAVQLTTPEAQKAYADAQIKKSERNEQFVKQQQRIKDGQA